MGKSFLPSFTILAIFSILLLGMYLHFFFNTEYFIVMESKRIKVLKKGVECSLINKCFNIIHADRCEVKECESACSKRYQQRFMRSFCNISNGGRMKGRAQCACEWQVIKGSCKM
ncbi:hypothetical protein YC2023_022671 [Brassica napus]